MGGGGLGKHPVYIPQKNSCKTARKISETVMSQTGGYTFQEYAAQVEVSVRVYEQRENSGLTN